MQRYVHNARQLAGQVDDDPVGAMRSQMREPVAAVEAPRFE
jgi:hypothetical protein